MTAVPTVRYVVRRMTNFTYSLNGKIDSLHVNLTARGQARAVSLATGPAAPGFECGLTDTELNSWSQLLLATGWGCSTRR